MTPKSKHHPTSKEAQAERLRYIRKRRGFADEKAAFEKFKWTPSTYRAHEGATNGFRHVVERYAEAFGVSASWLLTGVEEPDEVVPVMPEQDQNENDRVILLVGNVGSGGQIYAPEKEFKPNRTLEVRYIMSGQEEIWCFKVVGQDNFPFYRDGSLVVTQGLRDDPSLLVGEECIVFTMDGKVYLRTLRQGNKKGLYNLDHFRDEPIINVDVFKVARIYATIRPGLWEKNEKEGADPRIGKLPPIPSRPETVRR